MAGEDPNAHFKRYTGIRPPQADPRLPHYNPERDFGQIGQWLLNAYFNINRQPLTAWMPTAVALGITTEGDEATLKAAMQEAFTRVVEYLERACGAPIGDRQGRIIENDDELVHFRDAMQMLKAESGPAGVILQAMFGYYGMDMLFFAGRQERLMGMVGPMTLDKILPTIQRMGDAMRSGQHSDDFLIAGLKNATEACAAAGVSQSMIIRIVEQQLIDFGARMLPK